MKKESNNKELMYNLIKGLEERNLDIYIGEDWHKWDKSKGEAGALYLIDKKSGEKIYLVSTWTKQDDFYCERVKSEWEKTNDRFKERFEEDKRMLIDGASDSHLNNIKYWDLFNKEQQKEINDLSNDKKIKKTFGKITEQEAKEIDQKIINVISNLSNYKKENIKIFSEEETMEYLRSIEDPNKVIFCNFGNYVKFMNDENIIRIEIPNKIVSFIVIPKEDLDIRYFSWYNYEKEKRTIHFNFWGDNSIIILNK